ncbi:hypothetical protein IMCC3317_22950 [Kordia antarctica]|uniref:Uncharacterized protein n=1 Tax=Kordia antarctica TaxID=1218801 RepID=A0A7L4ZJX6_9FLAO|nr:hypothetical protein [Kordia antarctica]QHI36925.1 hypothetical protein IMCC3317_22950 [Kordia antarctica]
MKARKIINTVSAITLALFALLTLYLSSAVIFDWFGIRAKEGNYVLFIVWSNFICSILYLFAVYGFIKRAKWTFWVLLTALVILVVAFVTLKFYINNGGIHEAKTIKAMIFRISLTFTYTLLTYFTIKKTKIHELTK